MQLSIASFNLRYDKPDPGDRAWTVRRQAIAQLFHHYQPDIIGTQEGLAHQLADLQQQLPQYQQVGGDRQGDGCGEHCAIFYRADRLTCLETGDFWLSATPDQPGSISPDWGNPLPRMTTWAKLAIAATGQPLTVCNTHLDYESAKARLWGVKTLGDRLAQVYTPKDGYLLITGDFNCAPASLPRQQLLKLHPGGVVLQDALADLPLSQQMTYHDFTGRGFDPVDTVYYDSRLQLQGIMVDSLTWQGVWPSDHRAVMAHLEL